MSPLGLGFLIGFIIGTLFMLYKTNAAVNYRRALQITHELRNRGWRVFGVTNEWEIQDPEGEVIAFYDDAVDEDEAWDRFSYYVASKPYLYEAVLGMAK